MFCLLKALSSYDNTSHGILKIPVAETVGSEIDEWNVFTQTLSL